MNKLADAYLDTLYEEGMIPHTSPDDAILDLDARCTMLEETVAGLQEQVRQQALNMLTMAQRLRDFTTTPQSSIIRLN